MKVTYGVAVDVFRTFDSGKAEGPDGKGIPILGYEEWCESLENDRLVKRVMELPRQSPNIRPGDPIIMSKKDKGQHAHFCRNCPQGTV